MDFTDPPKRPRTESIVPMINVVFLLLIFFLMTSHLARPDPFEVTPPQARTGGETDTDPVIYIDRNGRISFDDVTGPQALVRLAAASAETPVIRMRADAAIPAKTLAGILRDLADAGLAGVELVVTQ